LAPFPNNNSDGMQFVNISKNILQPRAKWFSKESNRVTSYIRMAPTAELKAFVFKVNGKEKLDKVNTSV